MIATALTCRVGADMRVAWLSNIDLRIIFISKCCGLVLVVEELGVPHRDYRLS